MNEDLKREAQFELIKRKTREDLWSFCLYMNYDFFIKRKYPLKLIADTFTKGWNREGNYKIAVSTPPRTGKSTLINHFIVWSLGKEFSRAILRSSYSLTASQTQNAGARQLMKDNRYRLLFYARDIIEDTKTTLHFKGHHRPSLYATSRGGGVRSYGGSIIIADDMYKDLEEAMSDTINDKTIMWYDSEFRTRLDGNKRLEIMIGTRLRTGELIDVLEKKDYFDEIVKIPALTKENKSFCEEVMTTETLLELREVTHPAIFNSSYQQESMLAKDQLIEPSELKFVSYKEYKVNQRFAVIDGKTTGKDNLCCVILAETTRGLVVEDVLYTDKVLDVNLEKRLVSFLRSYDPVVCWVETNQDYSLYRNLNARLSCTVSSVHTTRNKEVKILVYSRYVKQLMFIDSDDKEYASFITDMYRYDVNIKNQKDDGLDALCMLIEKAMKRKDVAKWLI